MTNWQFKLSHLFVAVTLSALLVYPIHHSFNWLAGRFFKTEVAKPASPEGLTFTIGVVQYKPDGSVVQLRSNQPNPEP